VCEGHLVILGDREPRSEKSVGFAWFHQESSGDIFVAPLTNCTLFMRSRSVTGSSCSTVCLRDFSSSLGVTQTQTLSSSDELSSLHCEESRATRCVRREKSPRCVREALGYSCLSRSSIRKAWRQSPSAMKAPLEVNVFSKLKIGCAKWLVGQPVKLVDPLRSSDEPLVKSIELIKSNELVGESVGQSVSGVGRPMFSADEF